MLDTKNILVIFLVLTLAGVVTYLLLQKKEECPQPSICSVYYWSDNEINQSFDIIRSLDSNPPSQDILQQLVNELRTKVSFKDFVNAFSKNQDYNDNILQRYL